MTIFTPSSIASRPGALVAVIIIAIILLVTILFQLWFFWRIGRLVLYLKIYGIILVAIIVLTLASGLTFRLHHYFLGMLLLPFCSIPTRISTIYAFIVLGMMLDGISRWGFDSILQTSRELVGDGAIGSSIPTFNMSYFNSSLANMTANEIRNVTIKWNPIPSNISSSWDGFSLMIDDGNKNLIY